MKDDLPIATKVFLRAAELIEQGHCKYTMFRLNGKQCDLEIANQFCYHGALKKAALELGDDTFLYKGTDIKPFPFAGWNDRPDTTAAMVAQKLREQAFAS